MREGLGRGPEEIARDLLSKFDRALISREWWSGDVGSEKHRLATTEILRQLAVMGVL